MPTPENPQQRALRWAEEVKAHATAKVEQAMSDDPVNLDVHARREVLELGITAGYTATFELLVREGLLPTSGGAQ